MDNYKENMQEENFYNDMGDNLLDLFKEVLAYRSCNLDQMNDYPIIVSGDSSQYLHRWAIASEKLNLNYVKFLEKPLLSANKGILSVKDLKEHSEVEESNFFFLENFLQQSERKNYLEKLYTKTKDRLIYGLCCVYSLENSDSMLHISNSHNPLPMRVWINGTLVFYSTLHNLDRRHDILVSLRKGENLVLVERMTFAKDKLKYKFIDTFFLFSIKPLKYLLDKKDCQYFDVSYINNKYHKLEIVSEKAIYQSEEQLRFIVLSQYVTKAVQEKEITVCITDYLKNCMTIDANLNHIIEIPSNMFQQGILKVTVELKAEPDIKAIIYVMFGEYINCVDLLEEKNKKSISQMGDALSKMKLALDFEKSQVLDTIYPLDRFVYQSLFRFYWNLLVDGVRNRERRIFFSLPDKIQYIVKLGQISLPEGYSSGKRYPLVLKVVASYGYFPINGLTGEYFNEWSECNNTDAIIVSIPFIPEKYSDFDLILMADTITMIIGKYPIDTTKICLISICKSAHICLDFINYFPDVCTALALIQPNMEEHILENYKNTCYTKIIQLNNIEESLFLHNISWQHKIEFEDFWFDSGFEHEEFSNVYDSPKLMHKLLEFQKIEYPKRVLFRTDKPMFCRTYWIELVEKQHPNKEMSVDAECVNFENINIKTSNVAIVSLYIDRIAMKLNRILDININGCHKQVHIKDYGKINLSIQGSKVECEFVTYNKVGFKRYYTNPFYSRKNCGIIEVFLNEYEIVTVQDKIMTQNDLVDNLYIYLDYLMDDTLLKYRGKRLYAMNDNGSSLEKKNTIYVLHPILSKEFQFTYKKIQCLLKKECMMIGSKVYTGSFFAIIKTSSSDEGERNIVYVVYSSESVLKELNEFLSGIKTDTRFYEDVIIYDNGNYIFY